MYLPVGCLDALLHITRRKSIGWRCRVVIHNDMMRAASMHTTPCVPPTEIDLQRGCRAPLKRKQTTTCPGQPGFGPAPLYNTFEASHGFVQLYVRPDWMLRSVQVRLRRAPIPDDEQQMGKMTHHLRQIGRRGEQNDDEEMHTDSGKMDEDMWPDGLRRTCRADRLS